MARQDRAAGRSGRKDMCRNDTPDWEEEVPGGEAGQVSGRAPSAEDASEPSQGDEKPSSPIRREHLRIPTLPASIARLESVLQKHQTGFREIAREICRDPAIALRVLRLANSAAYGGREVVDSIETATGIVGAAGIKNILLETALIETYAHLEGCAEFDLAQLWRHSILTAQLSSSLARAAPAGAPGVSQESMYTCGLLHDLGKVVLFDSLGSSYGALIKVSRESERPLWRVEDDVLGYNHADVCVLMVVDWRLPIHVQAAIHSHHDPEYVIRGGQGRKIVYSADRLAHAIEETDATEARLLLHPVRHLLGLEERAYWSIVEEATKAFESPSQG